MWFGEFGSFLCSGGGFWGFMVEIALLWFEGLRIWGIGEIYFLFSGFEILEKFGFLILLLSFLSGKGSAFLAAATPSPLTTPNPLKKPFNGWLTPQIFIEVTVQSKSLASQTMIYIVLLSRYSSAKKRSPSHLKKKYL